MDYSFEAQQVIQALNSQSMSLDALTLQIARQNEINQKILDALIDLTLQEADDGPAVRDMEGNPI